MANKNIYKDFANQYELSKTLRFELKPIGKTLEKMKENIKYDKNLQTFLEDQKIENSYQTLKPVFDHLHENFINESLKSKTLKNIDFNEYLKKYRNKKEENLTPLENKLRSIFSDAYIETSKNWKKNENTLKEKGFKILTEKNILNYVEKNIENFSKIEEIEKIKNALNCFKDFFTYFTGFNQNRENYYETKDKKSTAIATRVIHDNLPKFCDNIIEFEKREDDYLNIYNIIKKEGVSLVKKDKTTIYPINKEIFKIKHYNKCLSQDEIEKYNEEVGNANSLINLYNQLNNKNKDFKRLQPLKTLYKQIGCGKKNNSFLVIDCDKKNNNNSLVSLEEILWFINDAGNKVFKERKDEIGIKSVPAFLKYIKSRGNYNGVYWSKAALNTVSNKYFANWYYLTDKLKEAGVFKATKKGSEDSVKIPDAIELEGFFNVINKEEKNLSFKESILENKGKIINESKNTSDALLNLIFNDIEENINLFLNISPDILEHKNFNDKELIKKWLDSSIAIIQMLKYFLVKEDKIREGNPIDSTITEALEFIINGEFNWFGWYDAIRNYLTKKKQDNINKLKLNFLNSGLASGWDINKESDNLCVMLKDQEENLYLGVINKEKKTIFEKTFIDGKGKNKKIIENDLYKINGGEIWQKMEYNFWPQAFKAIPKCSTQKKEVIEHFKNSNNDFIFPIGYKVNSGEKFEEECIITKEIFELNNKGYKKSNTNINTLMCYDSNIKKSEYIKKFQKEYWEILFKKNNPDKKEINKEWINFCKKDYSELKDYEKSYKDALIKWIDFCKYFLSKYPKTKLFTYILKDSKDYNSLNEFYNDIDKCSYGLNFDTKINKYKLDKLIDEGSLYLFQIKNQDYNKNKKPNHKDNLHTIYWKAVFEEIENRPKLNGGAEIFYRKALSQNELEKIKNKNNKEIIKNFRFSKDKFIFHISITLNFCQKNITINNKVNDFLKQNQDVYFLGIDRGENHLAYYSLINSKGEIINQGTLNLPFTDKDGKPRVIKVQKRINEHKFETVKCKNYNDLLDARAGNRNYARKNWQTIETIKDLKNGYISKVIHEIINIATNKDKFTFIVLENLNIGFKRGRQKIEKSVYQNLELALAKKLNFLVDKNTTLGNLGSVTNAIQLTPPVNNFGDIEGKKQFGNMLYIKADYTSQTDPITGWTKTIYIKKGSEKSIKEEIKKHFTNIFHDGKNYYFEYTDSFNIKWKLYSGLDRYYRKNKEGNWISTKEDTTEMLDKIFKNVDKSKSIYNQIMNENVKLEKINEHPAWESLRFAIHLIQQIRNQDNENNDFILSPVRDKNGKHFDSRKARENEPNCGDANGAFNIARKGIIVSEHIKRGIKELYIKDDEWRAWLAGKQIWEEWLDKEYNESK